MLDFAVQELCQHKKRCKIWDLHLAIIWKEKVLTVSRSWQSGIHGPGASEVTSLFFIVVQNLFWTVKKRFSFTILYTNGINISTETKHPYSRFEPSLIRHPYRNSFRQSKQVNSNQLSIFQLFAFLMIWWKCIQMQKFYWQFVILLRRGWNHSEQASGEWCKCPAGFKSISWLVVHQEFLEIGNSLLTCTTSVLKSFVKRYQKLKIILDYEL